MSGNIYGKLDCYSSNLSTVGAARNAQELWTNFWRFMETLETASYVTRITWNSGALSASEGGPAGTGYWDESAPFGRGAFGVWRWHTSSARNWEWYMYAQLCSSSYPIEVQATPQTIPGKWCGYNAMTNGSQYYAGVTLAAAVGYMGTVSFNPWNGTTSQGQAAKGSPVWVSSSTNQTMVVLPRSNNLGGAHVSLKENMVGLPIRPYIASGDNILRYSFFADRDGFVCVGDLGNDTTYNAVYVGDFALRNGLTGSGIANSARGFTMLFSESGVDEIFPTTTTDFGDTAGVTTTTNGGISIGNRGWPVGTARLFWTETNINDLQPNTFLGGTLDEYNWILAMYETPHFGIVGVIDSPLIRHSYGANSQDYSLNGRAWWSGVTTQNAWKLTTPWSGSAPGIATSRTGSNVVIPA